MIAELTADEGLRLEPYDDATGHTHKQGVPVVGYLTIGIGRNLDTNGITKDEAEYLLTNDINMVAGWLNVKLPWWTGMTDGRQRALINMVFNMGTGGILKWPMFLSQLQSGNYEAAAATIKNSLWYTQVGNRAARIANLIQYGD
jgi:lysozyme